VPQSYYAPLGLTAEDLFQPESREQAMQVVARLVAKAEGHLWHGLQYTLLIPRRAHRLRLMCAWPLLFAVRTLALSRSDLDVLGAEVKISRAEVKSIMRRSALQGWSNRWLQRYFDALNPGSSALARDALLPVPEVAPEYLPWAQHGRMHNTPGHSAEGADASAAGEPQSAQYRQSPTTSRR
jgi:hypothetical protein